VHVAGEAGHDHPALGVVEDALQHRPDLPLGNDEPGHVGVGGVDQEQVDALVAEPGEAGQVGQPAVQRQLVELDVAGVQHQTGGRADGHRERVRDGVVHREVLAVELAVPGALPLAHLTQVRGEPVFLALGGDQREGELGADDLHVRAQPQQPRDGADVVLVAVREHDGLDVVETVLDGAQVGQDQVHARRVLGREEHAAVDHEQPAGVLEHGHVAADLADAAQCDDPQAAFGQLGRLADRQLRVRRRGLGGAVALALARGSAVGLV